MKFIDTHAHLQMKTFKNDIERVVDDALAAGIEAIINVGFDVKSSEQAVELSQKYPFMFTAVGVHPHDAKTYSSRTLAILDGFLKAEKVIAVGEIGLDFKRNLSPEETQIKVFDEQLVFAQGKNIPVILHIRDAYSKVFETLEKRKPERVLLHCFSGTEADAEKAMKMGYFIAFGGSITYPKTNLSHILKSITLSKIVLETDAPFLSPVPRRGKRNEPSFIYYTAEKMAQIKGVTLKEVSDETTKNAKEFFLLGSDD